MILLASRGRPEKLARFFATGKPKLPGLVLLDEDDPRLDDYRRVELPSGWGLRIYPKTTVVNSLNRAVGELMADEPPAFIGWMADDVVPETKDWDILLALETQRFITVYPEDCVHGKCTHFFVNGPTAADLWEARGWFVPPRLKHLYFDDFWYDVAERFKRVAKLPEVVVRHRHFSAGGDFDRTYAERQTQGDSDAYAAFVRNELPGVISDLKRKREIC